MSNPLEPKNLIFSIIVIVWLIITAVVIGYPLITGRIKAGLDSVSRMAEPRKFWTTFAFSTVFFLVFSITVGFFVRWLLH